MIHARGLARTFATKHGKRAARSKPSPASTSTWPRGRSSASSAPTAPGKTTTLRMLTTLLKPTAGTATVAGYDLFRDPVERAPASATSRRAGRPAATRVPARRSSTTARLYGIEHAAGDRARAASSSASSTSTGCGSASPRRCPAASAAGSTSRWGSSTTRSWCSSTSRRPGSTRRPAPTSGRTSRSLRDRARQHGLPHHPLPRRGRRAVRPDPGHRPRVDRRQRHARRARSGRSPATSSPLTVSRAGATSHPRRKPLGRAAASRGGRSRGSWSASRRAGTAAGAAELLRALDRAGVAAGLRRGAPAHASTTSSSP